MKGGAFDHIVVGGGSAGCVLASRLSEDPDCRVLLLEAGGSGVTPFHRAPAANGFLFNRPAYDWGFYSTPQPELGGRRICYPRGKALGGSSGLNGMIYIRGNAMDYDLWRQGGLEGWGYADVLPYFRRSEGSHRGDGLYHGGDGPVRTSRSANFGPMEEAFVAAARESGIPRNDDFNGPVQHGAGIIDVTVAGGRRMSAVDSYVTPARRRGNLTILTGAHVLGLVIEGLRARGVRYRRNGVVESARADGEVLLALGAFGSPQALMLSGVGPADRLRSLGIGVVADLPGVGGNLRDHPDVCVQCQSLKPELSLARYQRLGPALSLGLDYVLRRKGPGASPFWGAIAFAPGPSSDERPDYQVFLTPMVLIENPGDAVDRTPREPWYDTGRIGRALFMRGKHAMAGLQLDVNLMRPESRGAVRLASADPMAPPLIDPNYLGEAADRTALVAAVGLARDILGQPAFADMKGAELAPGPDVRGDESLLDYVRATATTGHHPVGTCGMGADRDAGAVVGPDLKVRGIEGLRVVDASAMPAITSGNTNAPVMMIAEKAADMVRGLPPLPRAELPSEAA